MLKTMSILAIAGLVLALAPSAQAAFVAYHDFGFTASTGNITTQPNTGLASGSTWAYVVDTTPQSLIGYLDGLDTGVDISVASLGGMGMDSRDGKVVPPAGGTAADALFNVAGLNLTNGTISQGGLNVDGKMTITLTGLDSTKLYDVAFYGNRDYASDYQEQFILGGADSATNTSSAGVIDSWTTNVETRDTAGTGDNVIRWSNIDPGDDGTITVTMDPDILDLGFDNKGEWAYGNVGYLNAMRLEEQVPEPATMSLLAIGGLGLLARRKRRA